MKKEIKLYEEFTRNEELAGFQLVKKIPTDTFMEMLRNNSFEHGKQYVYRLVNYIPRTNAVYKLVGDRMIPFFKKVDKKAVKETISAIYSSPLIVYPKPIKYKPRMFYKNEDGTFTIYKGSSKKKLELCREFGVETFCGISLTSFFGNRTLDTEITDTDFLKLVNLLNDVFDNDKRHSSWIDSVRNYSGYIFDEVFVYKITDPEEAAETIIEECGDTIV